MKDSRIQLWATDEVHFQRHTSLIQMWAPEGEQPQVASASTREKIGFFGAINLKTGRLLTKEASTFNGDTFREFLEYLFAHTRGKIFLILDNAPWHKARDLKKFFIQNRYRLKRIFLPPYSPELNPIERVWGITRRKVTHNRYFKLVKELRSSLISCFADWEQSNNTLKTLCANL
ncbi:hypothetical protein AUJ66_00225 [Candidatus Desantisbacteria bacterium CG1_02_38_46]|uniref:Tc1-like transposase DDE domain-containing protein n=3 Tax=unclassified Candidatus Desantisiibacteriota TaxID=3106372 RepID=A0A2H9PAG7_9BACT|nr:MAG: hypothetical protein AUJ66_00225 [Candidatus Desantisbacteria bacterium CG1_02_38_46]PIU50989.1 MAG: hypothetical protein COS91_06785 [Candidatus Desantisbacteria bacterium CG07_land_8_20_14_0_80_39_15]PIZ15394.1 MAG: hypothetical protein COY51_05315 [Candidatus Desantisbacteria bacterium CG_4_10_14_0_8_um_filter_39_17]